MGFKEDLREAIMPLFGQEIPLAVINTLEALWREDKRPQIHSKKKTKDGWEFVFALPAGMTFRQFSGNEEAFRDSIGDVTTEMIWKNKMAILKVITKQIGKRYEYDFNYIADAPDMVLPIPVGYTHNGLHIEDLAQIPHVLVAGVTRSGKSNFIHTITNSLLSISFPPKIVMIDLKTLEYSYLENHVLLVTDLLNAKLALLRVVIEMKNRLAILKQARCVNIFKYNEKYPPMQHIVVIVDELAELDDKQAQESFETLAALSAATGVCLVAATQRPDKDTFKHFGRTKGNLLGRLCFRVTDPTNSRIALSTDSAAKLPKIKGRAIWKLDEEIEVQVPYLDPEIAEVKLLEQSPKMRGERLQNDFDNNRVGNIEHGTIKSSVIPILQSCSKALSTFNRFKKD